MAQDRVLSVARASAAACSGAGIFLCTSGTTGTPKGVLLGEKQLGARRAGSVSSGPRPDVFRVVEELPTGPAGKVARTRLRELAAVAASG